MLQRLNSCQYGFGPCRVKWLIVVDYGITAWIKYVFYEVEQCLRSEETSRCNLFPSLRCSNYDEKGLPDSHLEWTIYFPEDLKVPFYSMLFQTPDTPLPVLLRNLGGDLGPSQSPQEESWLILISKVYKLRLGFLFYGGSHWRMHGAFSSSYRPIQGCETWMDSFAWLPFMHWSTWMVFDWWDTWFYNWPSHPMDMQLGEFYSIPTFPIGSLQTL